MGEVRRADGSKLAPALVAAALLAAAGQGQAAARPLEQPPTAASSSVATKVNTPVNVPLAAADPDGDPLTYVIVAPPSHGTLSGTGAARTYQPATNYVGPDSFTFKANDGVLDSNTAAVSITVSGIIPPVPPPKPRPSPQTKLVAARVSGKVLVQLRRGGRFVPVTSAAEYRYGVTFDATRGALRITVAEDRKGGTATFVASGGKFVPTQDRTLLTTLALTGGNFGACHRQTSVRRLWGDGKGRFRTTGRYSAATVRSAHWSTDDRCDGTLTYVKRGSASVRDYPRRRTVTVRQGHRYLAEPS
jgi:hypothetical protein